MSERLARSAVTFLFFGISCFVPACRGVLDSPETLSMYFRETIPAPWMGHEPKENGDAVALAARLARSHSDARYRAVALSYAVFWGKGERVEEESGTETYFRLLRDVFATDPDAIVRRAAIRIAGILGPVEGNLDLKKLIVRERDPDLLRDAIEARCLWSTRRHWINGLRLGDGLLCDWISRCGRHSRGLDSEEVARLEEVLRTEREPGVRDSASTALTDHQFGPDPPANARNQEIPERVRIAGLKVHEWGVWHDGGDTLEPSAKLIEDLPPFVHRSNVGAAEYWTHRAYTPMTVTKPVVFFYSPGPVLLSVTVGFFEGRPWTFFPRATDYTDEIRYTWHSSRNPRLRKGDRDSREKELKPPLSDGDGLSPNWIPRGQEPPTPPAVLPATGRIKDDLPDSLRPYYAWTPWTLPQHHQCPTITMTGEYQLASIGLQWFGLRVGYPDSLEGSPPPVPADHWWSFLREVPSTPVAVRGEREKFLFYDGAVNAPPPVRVSWPDASREALVLKVRNFKDYPPVPEGAIERWPEVFRRSGVLGSEKEPKSAPLPAIFVVQKLPGQEPRGKLLADLLSQAEPPPVPLASLDLAREALRSRFDEVLTAQGLTPEETRSLVRTWEKEFFLTDGLRVITILPQWLYHSLLPIEIDPVPGELVRVGLILNEVDSL